MENQMKLLMSAFIVILLGAVLIQPIADDVELVKTSSYTVLNESVSLTVTTLDVLNESNTMIPENTTTLTHNYVTVLTELRNSTDSRIITSYCNITLHTGVLICNDTGGTTIYAEYTHNAYSTGTLTYDELVSFDACRNSTMLDILAGTHCNVTLGNGAVKVDYDNFSNNLAFIDYKYIPDVYVRSPTARSLLNLVVLLFVIMILAVGAGYAIKSFKDSGVM